MPLPRPTEDQLDRSIRAGVLGTRYHALIVVGLQGIRGAWHRARTAGGFAGMLAAEAHTEWVLGHARAKLEALGEAADVTEAYLAAALEGCGWAGSVVIVSALRVKATAPDAPAWAADGTATPRH